MSVLQRTIRMFVLAAMAVAGQVGMSQEGYHPFSEPMSFDPDWQFFAPVQMQDLQDLTARQRANNGFYVAYDRMQIGLNRSDTESREHQNRLHLGKSIRFRLDEQQGIGLDVFDHKRWWPQCIQPIRAIRLNQFIRTRNESNALPPEFQNDDGIRRVFLIQDSVNVGAFSTFEANKVWRMEPYRYGGILEPMVGLRYAFFGDGAANDVYTVGPGRLDLAPCNVYWNFRKYLAEIELILTII